MNTYKKFIKPKNPCHQTLSLHSEIKHAYLKEILRRIKEKRKEQNKKKFLASLPKNITDIYTDGSYDHPMTGSGIYSQKLEWQKAFRVNEQINSNAVAEMKAI